MEMLMMAAILVCVCGALAMAEMPAVTLEGGAVRSVPVRGRPGVREATVVLPRTWMTAPDALVQAHRQAGFSYAVLPPEFGAAVGPFTLGDPVAVGDLAERVAAATGTRLEWVNDVAVFEPKKGSGTLTIGSPTPVSLAADHGEAVRKRAGEMAESSTDPRSEVSALDHRGDTAAVVRLTALAGHEDGSVRLHALAALKRMEGDFIRQAWPGRVSILEVLSDRIDHDALLFALEEGGPVGGRVWKLAVELLGRARERVLARYLWYVVWMKRDGTVELGLWALGRCGDQSGGWAMRGRVRETFTNNPAHRYLAAMALGQLNGTSYLTPDRESPEADLRRAVAFGLGFCRATDESAWKNLVDLAGDQDPSVRFVACQSLARLGSAAAVERLLALAAEAAAPADTRAAAMEALVALGRPEAPDAILARAADADLVVRAQAARLLGDVGGPKAEAQLAKLAGDGDRYVRAAAIHSLARLGTANGIQRAAAVAADAAAGADERIAALLGLGAGLAPAAAEPLATVALDAAAPSRLRHYAILGLARLAERAGQKHLALLADRESGKHLAFALRHLDLGALEATAAFLIPYLTHGSRDDVCAAAGRLAELGYGPGVVELLEGGDVFDNHSRMTHLWGTVRASGREVTLALVAAAANRRGSIRRQTAFALAGRLYPEAVDALVALAQDRDPSVRAAAAQSLGLTPDPKAVPLLIELAAKDPDLPVAIEAGRALRLRDFRHLPEVKAAFEALAGTVRDPGGIASQTPSVAEQPANTFVLRAWAEHEEEDLVCNLTYESSICYDAHRGRVVQWGAHGRRYDTPQTALTWFYDASTNQWTALSTSREWPLGTCGVRGTMYDRANRAVVSPRSGGSNAHGWHNALRANLRHGSPWVLDVTTDQWYPAAPTTIWSGGYMPASHDPVHGVTVWWRDGLVGYDVYANRWTRFKPNGPVPDCPADTGAVFDPRTGRLIAVAARSTWAYDPAKNAWTDLKPEGPHPGLGPMVYDPANDVMLIFQAEGEEVGVWAYHLRENRWEKMPTTYPCPARGKIWDAAFDEKNGVAVITGTHPKVGTTASPNNRETWTYRYQPAGEKPVALGAPLDVACVTAGDGHVTITWTPAPGVPAVKFRIERGAGDEPWLVQWEPAGEAPAGEAAFTDRPKEKRLTFYRVIAVGSDGAVSRPSFPARTVPRMVHQVTAVVRREGGVRLRWAAGRQPDIVGYRVYRAPVDLESPWTKRFSPESVAGTLKRITETPVAGAEFVDAEGLVTGPADELMYPKTFAYVVRPVNAWGLEGGPSPATLALPDPPGPVQVVPWADGRRLVLWSTCLSGGTIGYHLMRMDDWHSQYVFRMQGAPLAAPAFWDGEEFPTGDRRLYHASGIDPLGTVGIPTSGAWSHGYP